MPPSPRPLAGHEPSSVFPPPSALPAGPPTTTTARPTCPTALIASGCITFPFHYITTFLPPCYSSGRRHSLRQVKPTPLIFPGLLGAPW
ncbi:hypothetical protein E2C01_023313 [Portunus trituberculatus]|uniref:Uncharacterized protein n=1 Tax=Portunus trituberculatus TaxID=210409 RepID=A0A5B7E7N6_PORTR|nr:hypothetical protein [Portunus trituberculatus]